MILTLIKRKSSLSVNIVYRDAFWYLTICTIGVIIYMILIAQQFIAHDYYMLDTFLPLLVFWSFGYYQIINKSKIKRLFILFCILGLAANRAVYSFGFDPRKESPLEITRTNFVNSEISLDSLGISVKHKILLIDAYSPNLAFINMNRQGYCVMTTSYTNIQKSLDWQYDYIITQNFSYENDVLSNYPNFEKETSVFFKNDKFTIRTKK